MDDDVIPMTDMGNILAKEDKNHNLILTFTKPTTFLAGDTITVWSSFIYDEAKQETLK